MQKNMDQPITTHIAHIVRTIHIALTEATIATIRDIDMSFYDDAIAYAKDELGHCLTLQISTKVFPLEVVQQTAYWYTDDYYLFIDISPDGSRIIVEFRIKKGDSLEGLDVAVKQFCNDLVDQFVRKQVKSETREIETIIVKRAFSAALSPEELAKSRELR